MCSTLNQNSAGECNYFAASKADKSARLSYFDQLINGNFLRAERTASAADKVTVCLSTVCALMKQFELDWIAERIADRPVSVQRDFMAATGAYLELPLRTLSDLMTRVRTVGRRTGMPAFQSQVDGFLSIEGDTEGMDPRVLLFTYLATAIACHNLWQNRRPVTRLIPWQVRSAKHGNRFYLRYNFTTSKHGKRIRRCLDYRLPFSIPKMASDVYGAHLA